MSPRRLILPAALLVALLLPASATAAPQRVFAETEVFIGDVYNVPGNEAAIVGGLYSSHRRCVANRTVRVSILREGRDPRRFDTARTGKGGGWAAIGSRSTFNGGVAIRAAATKRRIRLSGDRVLVCKASQIATPFRAPASG